MIELTFWEFWGYLVLMGFIGLIGGCVMMYFIFRLKDEINKLRGQANERI